jgi:hypothetical protein
MRSAWFTEFEAGRMIKVPSTRTLNRDVNVWEVHRSY